MNEIQAIRKNLNRFLVTASILSLIFCVFNFGIAYSQFYTALQISETIAEIKAEPIPEQSPGLEIFSVDLAKIRENFLISLEAANFLLIILGYLFLTFSGICLFAGVMIFPWNRAKKTKQTQEVLQDYKITQASNQDPDENPIEDFSPSVSQEQDKS